jgi:hypothetical protein
MQNSTSPTFKKRIPSELIVLNFASSGSGGGTAGAAGTGLGSAGFAGAGFGVRPFPFGSCEGDFFGALTGVFFAGAGVGFGAACAEKEKAPATAATSQHTAGALRIPIAAYFSAGSSRILMFLNATSLP